MTNEAATPPALASNRLAVGFDLDLTLVDTRAGIGQVLRAVGAEFGVDLPIEEITSRLGPPLEMLLMDHVPEGQIPALADRFRSIYPEHAIVAATAMPGARDALSAVRRHGGRVVVVTGKYTANAELHLDHLDFEVDHLEGWVWGTGKAKALIREGACVYVGDHVHDVEGALAAGALSVSVLSGGCTRVELEEAGTHVVLDDLTAFPSWLDDYLASRDTPIS